MNPTSLSFSRPDDRLAARRYRTAVSLHSHTLHSRESLALVPGVGGKLPLLGPIIRRHQARWGVELDLARAWWTPPLCAVDAWRLESGQISRLLSMAPLVSLTDHDNIDAANTLALVDRERKHPVSIEWTVPFRESFFHLGVHNLPPARAPGIVTEMQCFTGTPSERVLAEMLATLQEVRDVLVVFNHPCWDEKGIGAARHAGLLREFLSQYRPFLHAIELNGLRPGQENQVASLIADSVGLPVISGGDRHGREPNAIVNLTNARSFSEFAEEVRRDGWSLPLFLPQYHEPHAWRVVQMICDALRADKEHGLGWTRWSDRVFYLCDDGVVRSLTSLWRGRPPLLVSQIVGLAQFAGNPRMREALRFALVRKDVAIEM